MAEAVAGAARLLDQASRVLVLTGAGMSAPSGVPTFRGATGLWRRYRPEDLATPQAFARDPRLVWEWYGWRRALIAACRPNRGHLALARWMARHEGVTLVTQNVDGLHEEAAARYSAPPPVRLHGSIFRVRCLGCGREDDHRDPIDASHLDTLPRCPACGALVRPAVVWFGEVLPGEALRTASTAAAASDVCLVIGTSGTVHPAAAIAHHAASSGAMLIVVDPEETAYDAAADVRLFETADRVLPVLLDG